MLHTGDKAVSYTLAYCTCAVLPIIMPLIQKHIFQLFYDPIHIHGNFYNYYYQQQRHVPDLTRKPSASALKKSPSSSSEGGSGVGQLQGGGGAARKKKAPAFNDRYTVAISNQNSIFA